MRVNKIKTKLKNGERVFGTMIKEARNVNIPEILEIAGFDYFVIDMEHASYDMSDIAPILEFARKTEITAVVRIPRLDYAYVAKTLDMGAEGIWVPHLDTVEEAKALVGYGKYPPEGKRGAAVPIFRLKERQEFKQAADYFRAVNDETLLIAQMESGVAIGNVEAITAVPGIDVAMMGTQDLSLDLGYPGQGNHPEMRAAVQKVVDACRKNGKASGNHIPGIDDLRYWIGQGMQMITWSYETNMIIDRGREALKLLKS
ncbi:MAG: aldolase/citrate lyase family protein [Syntrophales bacterium]|nr:aldolase/citrate lyase family protein [Syntrophales bacterium]